MVNLTNGGATKGQEPSYIGGRMLKIMYWGGGPCGLVRSGTMTQQGLHIEGHLKLTKTKKSTMHVEGSEDELGGLSHTTSGAGGRHKHVDN